MIINEDSLFCSFVQVSDKTYECYKCGVTLVVEDEIDEPPIIPCAAPIAEYSASGIRNHISENISDPMHLCSEEEIEKRHTICSTCEHFTGNSCSQCGCVLSRDKIYMNKLAIKSQSCPIKKW